MEDQSFFITINCSSVLNDSEETQYSIFIDTLEMSIVYEVVEWIRWMFSVEKCIYLTHKDCVIHEMEDVEVLRKLGSFEVKTCGKLNCVHKKLYRKLLEEVNVWTSYNNKVVHKCFLDKIQKIRQKQSFKMNESSQLFSGTKSCRITYENSCSNVNSGYINNQGCNGSFDINNLQYKSSPVGQSEKSKVSDKTQNPSPNETPPAGSKEHSSSGNLKRPNFKRHARPFSLGEMLSNIRAEIKDESFKYPEADEKLISLENSVESENQTTEVRKRKRIRRRKKAVKREFEDEFTSCNVTKESFSSSFKIPHIEGQKPNHIRFDEAEEDDSSSNTMTSYQKEVTGEEVSYQNNGYLMESEQKLEVNIQRPEQQVVGEEKPAGPSGTCLDIASEKYGCSGSIQSDDFLLSLKEKCKNSTVVKRF